MLELVLFLLAASAASFVPSEELRLGRKRLIENIEEATPACFYDGDFEKMRESPYPLNEGDRLVLVRTVASSDSGKVALTFCKHNCKCSLLKRIKHDYFSLKQDTKNNLELAKRALIAGSIAVGAPALVGGSLALGGVAGIVWVSGGTSYAVAYTIGIFGGMCTGLAAGCACVVPMVMLIGDAPTNASPRRSCCAYEGDNQLYSVVYSDADAADIASKYALEYMKKAPVSECCSREQNSLYLVGPKSPVSKSVQSGVQKVNEEQRCIGL